MSEHLVEPDHRDREDEHQLSGAAFGVISVTGVVSMVLVADILGALMASVIRLGRIG